MRNIDRNLKIPHVYPTSIFQLRLTNRVSASDNFRWLPSRWWRLALTPDRPRQKLRYSNPWRVFCPSYLRKIQTGACGFWQTTWFSISLGGPEMAASRQGGDPSLVSAAVAASMRHRTCRRRSRRPPWGNGNWERERQEGANCKEKGRGFWSVKPSPQRRWKGQEWFLFGLGVWARLTIGLQTTPWQSNLLPFKHEIWNGEAEGENSVIWSGFSGRFVHTEGQVNIQMMKQGVNHITRKKWWIKSRSNSLGPWKRIGPHKIRPMNSDPEGCPPRNVTVSPSSRLPDRPPFDLDFSLCCAAAAALSIQQWMFRHILKQLKRFLF